MTKNLLNPDQRRTVEIIQMLRFGRIEQLWIRGGTPSYEKEPRVVQEIKLGSRSDQPVEFTESDLKKDFASFFDELSRLPDVIVDVEFRHGLPFRLVVNRGCKEFVQQLGQP